MGAPKNADLKKLVALKKKRRSMGESKKRPSEKIRKKTVLRWNYELKKKREKSAH